MYALSGLLAVGSGGAVARAQNAAVTQSFVQVLPGIPSDASCDLVIAGPPAGFVESAIVRAYAVDGTSLGTSTYEVSNDKTVRLNLTDLPVSKIS